VHVVFFLGEMLDSPDGEGQANFLLSVVMWLIDTTGVMGFVICMLLLTKINHYANFSTSGGWTTSWLLVTCSIPLFWKLMDIFEWIGGFVGSEFTNPLPMWNFSWFALLGVFSFLVMVTFTLLYQRSFQYAITDKRIHICQSFLYFETRKWRISRPTPLSWGAYLDMGTYTSSPALASAFRWSHLESMQQPLPKLESNRREKEDYFPSCWSGLPFRGIG
jgi:hypothetical protein